MLPSLRQRSSCVSMHRKPSTRWNGIIYITAFLNAGLVNAFYHLQKYYTHLLWHLCKPTKINPPVLFSSVFASLTQLEQQYDLTGNQIFKYRQIRHFARSNPIDFSHQTPKTLLDNITEDLGLLLKDTWESVLRRVRSSSLRAKRNC